MVSKPADQVAETASRVSATKTGRHQTVPTESATREPAPAIVRPAPHQSAPVFVPTRRNSGR